MFRTPRLAPVMLLPIVLAAAACGDDSPAADQVPSETLPPATAAPPTTAPATAPPTASPVAYQHATGADDVVVSVAFEGGFLPVELVFAQTPLLLVTGDGRALTTGPVPAIFPGPLLPNVLERTITEQATQQLLALADDLGLLADVTYARNDMIADAADTVVEITVDGTTYRHQAYALEMDAADDPDKASLAEFVAAATDLAGTVGADELGPEEPFAAEEYLIQARPVDPATMSADVEPTVEPWPADAPVRLADAGDCALVPAELAEALFADATTLTFFDDGDTTYQVSAVHRLPGRTC